MSAETTCFYVAGLMISLVEGMSGKVDDKSDVETSIYDF